MHAHCLTQSKYSDYDECHLCGTLIRHDKPDSDAVYGNAYWDQPERSSLEDQVYNIVEYRNEAGESKADVVLRYCNTGLSVLEIGCGPGVLLPLLRKNFQKVIGNEYDEAYADRIRAIAGCGQELIFGAFPQVTKRYGNGAFNCIIALDLLEHIEDGQSFMKEVRRLLCKDGCAILMMPALFGCDTFDERFLHPEHVAIYSQDYLNEWFREMFEDVFFTRWVTGHEIVIAEYPK